MARLRHSHIIQIQSDIASDGSPIWVEHSVNHVHEAAKHEPHTHRIMPYSKATLWPESPMAATTSRGKQGEPKTT